MRTPKDSKSRVTHKVPVGGNAYERILQERSSRGLGELSSPPAPKRTGTPAVKKAAKPKGR